MKADKSTAAERRKAENLRKRAQKAAKATSSTAPTTTGDDTTSVAGAFALGPEAGKGGYPVSAPSTRFLVSTVAVAARAPAGKDAIALPRTTLTPTPSEVVPTPSPAGLSKGAARGGGARAPHSGAGKAGK